jgi:mannosyltransferase
VSAGTFAAESRNPPATARRTSLADNRAAALVFALTALAAILRFWGLGHQGYWFDEANTALLVHFSPGKMLGLIPQSESTPPLYYCVAWVWARIFGLRETGLRSLSALAGTAVVPAIYGAGAKLISGRAGVIAAALAACSPLLIWYSQEARSYSMLVLLSSLALLAFTYAREDPSRRWVAAWVICSALALGTHYYAILAIAPQAIWLIAAHPHRRPVQVGVGLVGLFGLALVPLALSQSGTGRANWIATAALGRRLSQVPPQFLAGFQLPDRSVLVPLAGVLAAVGLVAILWLEDQRTRRRSFGIAGIALGGLLLNLALIAGGIDDLITRNLLALWPVAALAVAAGLSGRRPPLLGLTAAVGLCAIGVTGAVATRLDRTYQRPDWRGVAYLLGPKPAIDRGERAIVVQHYRDLLPLSLYLHGLRWIPAQGARVSELDIVSFSSPPSGGFCWWGSACNLWPSAIQTGHPIGGFHELWRRRIYQFTVVRRVADAPVLVTRAEVARLLETTRFQNDELLVQR